MGMTRRWLPVGLFVGWLAVTAVALGWSTSSEDAKPTLADRINAACTRPDFEVSDWTAGDEYQPVPEGIVRVTCSRYPKDGGAVDTYTVAVPR